MGNVKKGEIFNSVKVASLPRNTFDLTHQHCTTMRFGDLVPICVMEAIPGDKFTISSETFIRLQPMITPMMHRCDFTVHYFYVPNRILWSGFEDFITGNRALETGLNTPALPYFTTTKIASVFMDGRHFIFNYMGCEVGFATKLNASGHVTQVNALPIAAYNKIYWDYYVPRELQQAEQPTYKFAELADGNNDTALGSATSKLGFIMRKGWARDYFTSALPFAQKGTAVDLPLGTVELISEDWQTTGIPKFEGRGDQVFPNALTGVVQTDASTPGDFYISGSGATGYQYAYDPQGTLVVGATTINDLRRAMRLQEWLEKNARAGTRYTESLRAHFNVMSSDARLQRAEYITGVKSPIIVSEVLNNTGETDGLPQGNMSGHGIGIAEGYTDTYYCEEHGWIIGLLSVTPKAAYSTGLPRFFTKRADFMDWYWSDFANLGEQEIEQIELQASMSPGQTPTDTFGYIPRYSEYKFKNDMVTGDFADAGSGVGELGSLRTWVMQRTFGDDYGTDGLLNTSFITADIGNVAAAPFAIEDTPIMVQQLNKIYASRQMPVYGTPSF